jgi:hypothetical protein
MYQEKQLIFVFLFAENILQNIFTADAKIPRILSKTSSYQNVVTCPCILALFNTFVLGYALLIIPRTAANYFDAN